MRGKNFIVLFRSPRALLAFFAAIVICGVLALPMQASAADLPLAAGSPLTGLSFDDRPLLLPVQRNFQMAMLTSSSQIGRSCGRMESYGWRMAQTEQKRVNLIFSNTVDRLRGLGYAVEAQTPSSISKDITLFTADRPDKHFLFMWSAGEIGLVMVLCESSPPLTGRMASMYNASPAPIIQPPQDVLQSKLETPAPGPKRKIYDANGFTPVGDWIGDYTCMRGYTGATLHIDKFKADDFKGVVRFYPTSKNPYIPKGSYEIYGQYDRESRRILINPGKWLEHPNGYYKTIIIGSFDPINRSFSGFFQGIMGCTSFEAKSDGKSAEVPAKTIGKKHVKPKKHKKKAAPKPQPAKTAPVEIQNLTPDEAIAPILNSTPPAAGSSGINLPGGTAKPTVPAAAPAAPVSTVTVPSAAAPVPAPAALPAATPAPSSLPVAPSVTAPHPGAPASGMAPSAPASAPPASVPWSPTPVVPAATAPSLPLAVPAAPVTAPPVTTSPDSSLPITPAPTPAPAAPPSKPVSSLAPKAGPHAIVLAGDWPATPWPPLLPPAETYNVGVQQLPAAQTYSTDVGGIPPAQTYPVEAPAAEQASTYNVTVQELPPAEIYNAGATELPPASIYSTDVPSIQRAQPYNTDVPELPTAPSYEIYKAPGS